MEGLQDWPVLEGRAFIPISYEAITLKCMLCHFIQYHSKCFGTFCLCFVVLCRIFSPLSSSDVHCVSHSVRMVFAHYCAVQN